MLKSTSVLILLAAHMGWAANVITIASSSGGFSVDGTAVAQGWTQTSSFQNVTIQVPLLDDMGSTPDGIAYLVTQIGPGATSANNAAPPVTVSGLTASFSTRTLWTGLTLGPGTYYVVFVSTVGGSDSSLAPHRSNCSNEAAVTTASGVSSVTMQTTTQSLASFAPATGGFVATSFCGGDAPANLAFITVTGDPGGGGPTPTPTPNATPAPPSLILLLLALASVAVYFGVKSHQNVNRA